MSRSRYAWEYATFCNFGELGRKRLVMRHFSLRAADKAFKILRKRYSHEARDFSKDNWRCWQENRAGDHIINDTNYLDRMIYA
jgi:hypothetical protein